jgi:hypothetical protein
MHHRTVPAAKCAGDLLRLWISCLDVNTTATEYSLHDVYVATYGV